MNQEMKQREAPQGWVAGRFEIETREGRGHRDGWFHPELGVGLCPGRGEMAQWVEVTSLDLGVLLLHVEADLFDVAFAMNKHAQEVARFLARHEAGAVTREQRLDLAALVESGARGYKGRAWVDILGVDIRQRKRRRRASKWTRGCADFDEHGSCGGEGQRGRAPGWH